MEDRAEYSHQSGVETPFAIGCFVGLTDLVCMALFLAVRWSRVVEHTWYQGAWYLLAIPSGYGTFCFGAGVLSLALGFPPVGAMAGILALFSPICVLFLLLLAAPPRHSAKPRA